MNSLGDSIRHGALWIFTGSTASRVSQFAFGIILARLLGPEPFGLLVTISIFTGVAGFFAAGGMGQALVQAKHVDSQDYNVVFTIQGVICATIYALFFLIAPLFAVWFGNPIYEPLLRLSAVTFLIRPFLNAPMSYLQRAMRFREVAILRFAGGLVSSITSVILAWLGYGVWSLVIGGLFGTAVMLPATLWRAGWLPSVAFSQEVAKRLGAYGVKFSANEIIRYMKAQTSNLLLSKALGPVAVGMFNKARTLSELPRELVLGPVYQPLFRGMARMQDDNALLKYLFYRGIALFALYTLPIYVSIWWLAEPFILLVYGDAWMSAVEPLQILSLTGLLSLGHASGALIEAKNRLGSELFINVETWVVLILACVIGLQHGISGVAWALVGSVLYNNLRTYTLASRCVGGSIRRLVRALAPAYALNAILFGALWLIDAALRGAGFDAPIWHLAVMGGSAVALYTLLILNVPFSETSSEAKRLRKLLKVVLGHLTLPQPAPRELKG